MITLDTLTYWLSTPRENEHLEFKEAKQQFDKAKLLRYCVALANESGGHLVLGVTDKPPRKIVGTQAFQNLGDIKARILETLGFRVEITELQHPDGRVLVFEIPPRPVGTPLHLEGAYLMRAGEDLVPMSSDQLRRILAEGAPDWFEQPAKQNVTADEVVALLDTQSFFELIGLPYPTSREGVLARLAKERLIVEGSEGWLVTHLAAIMLAKRLDSFSPELARKSPRVVIYEGINKLVTREDKPGVKGYAVGFESLVDFVHSAAPQNRYIEQVVREEVKMFPRQAIRELIANALIHQDFQTSGTSVMIEMYADRLEISNPGLPSIKVERFIDEYRSRNERLADLMRRMGICEEKGSGIDKVIDAAEVFQLPAPDFRVGETRTTAILFAHQDFADMSKPDRIRACYQHCCLQYVSNHRMSNQSLRERFKLLESKAATVSLVIGATKDAGLIKADESDSTSTRYARYLPFWA
ncbi:MAG: ATP-binding protein [Methylovulum sp.]|uniref:ATP-binding protein n=1 Tax=Methylovulum TaxID=762296 RepID=UPI00035C42E7|nr:MULTISPECIES: ATP-binding protein [Methylovulum]MDD2723425.1 ATP-binding protein [Methylovulum sp.]MDD5115174.1 ATP-binding protein [Methylobacter sp.]